MLDQTPRHGWMSRELVEALRAVGYTAEGVRDALDPAADPADCVSLRAFYAATRAAELSGAAGSPVEALAAMLWLGADLPARAYRQLVPAGVRDELARARLVHLRGAVATPAMAIVVVDDAYFIADHSFRWSPSRSLSWTADAAAVSPPGASSLEVLGRLPGGPLGRVLDLGCGTGVVGISLAHRAEAVAAVDLNPRAVAYTRRNAGANGAGVEVAECDAFALADSTGFDRIVFNAPTLPDAGSDPPGYGTMTTEQVLALALDELPRILRRPGAIHVLFLCSLRGELEDLAADIDRRVRTAGEISVRVLPLAAPRYALTADDVARGRVRPGSALLREGGDGDRMIGMLRRAGIRSVAPVILEVQAGAAAPGTVELLAPVPSRAL